MNRMWLAIVLCLCFACSRSKSESGGSSRASNSAPPSSSQSPLTSSRAYKGHQNDRDVNALVQAFPSVRGSRLDDCQTCHKGGSFSLKSDQKTVPETKNPCDYCHLLQHPSTEYQEPQPKSFADTLNSYGSDYLKNGRNGAALQAIGKQDSDGDGFANQAEIEALKYPGDPTSKPGQKAPPLRTLTGEQLRALPQTTEFLLANLSKHRDYYASYTGVKIRDLLHAVGVDPADPGLQGITVVSPDGYLKDFPVDRVNRPYPPQLFFPGLDNRGLGEECGLVQYPSILPPGLSSSGPIPGEAWLLLALEREGKPLEPARLDLRTGKADGEGPYRMVVPQAVPGKPDRGSHSKTKCKDGYEFDPHKDHNAGDMVRGVVGIRLNPLPAGYEDFDSKNGGWAYVTSGTLLVYGYGIR